jgi:monoamine oxidase
MHGGRKSPLGRALREHAWAEAKRGPDDPPLDFDETLATFQKPGLSRRDLLKAGGLLGAGVALAACTKTGKAVDGLASASAPASVPTPHDARVVVVGAGLAGVSAAYQLSKAGVHVQLFEARDRLGGRCWSSRDGWADGQTAEHGGEFIDTRHVHIRQLAKELGLPLDDLFASYVDGTSYPRYVNGNYLTVHETKAQVDRIYTAAKRTAEQIGVLDANGHASTKAISYGTATPGGVKLDQLSMSEWLDRNVHGILGTDVGQWLDQAMCGWYGLNMDDLSAANWMDYSIIPAPGADERWHVRGGNDQVISGAIKQLPQGTVHASTALTSVRRRADGTYELGFDGMGAPVLADLLILTLPTSTMRQVDLTQAGYSDQTVAAIADLAMGHDVKLLVQYDRRPATMNDWSGGLESADPDFDTWDSSVAEEGKAGLITVYSGGRTGSSWSADTPHGVAPDTLTSQVVDRMDEIVPGSAAHFNGKAWADLWTRDPWTNGAYAAFIPGQYTRFWGGVGQAEGNTHIAGEATSTYSQGYLNGGVESGYRVAIEVMKKLGVPVPASLANLPYSKTTPSV